MFSVDPRGGTIRPFPDGEGRAVLVMMGNPTIHGFPHRRADGQEVEALWIKADTVVAWIDLRRVDALDLFEGLRPAEDTGRAPKPVVPRKGPGAAEASVIQDAVLGIYAEGAVELVYGNLSFRATRLHLEPRTFQALLIGPRFTGVAPRAEGGENDLPLYVRAREARLVAQGVTVFEDAEVSVSRADDRMALQVASLTVREEQQPEEGDAQGGFGRVPSLLGFRTIANQTYHAEGVQVRGERLPLAYWRRADFSYPFAENMPFRFRGFTTGQRRSQGRYGTVTFGGKVGPSSDPLLRWDVGVGGYTKRGPALGVGADWDKPRTRGKAKLWGIYEFRGKDITGFIPPADTSVSIEIESTGNDCITWVAQVLSVPVAEPPAPTPTPTPTPAPPTPTPTPTPA
ncbi:MAG: hypothetical protein ACC662_12295, partial [Planctomycetota bacterium]